MKSGPTKPTLDVSKLATSGYAENEDVPGHLVRRLSQLFSASVTDAIQPFGVTRPQFNVLTFIYRHPETDQKTVARRQSMDGPTTAEIIRRLVEKGLVDRRRSTTDKRANRLQLTAKGVAIAEEALPLAGEAHERCMANLTAAERADFLRLASKVLGIENIYYSPDADDEAASPAKQTADKA